MKNERSSMELLTKSCMEDIDFLEDTELMGISIKRYPALVALMLNWAQSETDVMMHGVPTTFGYSILIEKGKTTSVLRMKVERYCQCIISRINREVKDGTYEEVRTIVGRGPPEEEPEDPHRFG